MQILNYDTVPTPTVGDNSQIIANTTFVAAAIQNAASVQVLATLLSTGWSGSSAPYTQTVSITGMTATKNGSLGLAQSATAAQRAAAYAAIITVTSQASGTITVTADSILPTVNIPIVVTLIN